MSRFGSRLGGAGSFINISQIAKQLVFVGSFLAGQGGHTHPKFVPQVEQRTFSGRDALRRGQPVQYATERAVFALHERGRELIEVGPELDVERDVPAPMRFRSLIERDPAPKDAAIVADGAMGLRERLLRRPLAGRVAHDAASRTPFIDFARHDHRATRYRTTGFVRASLGPALAARGWRRTSATRPTRQGRSCATEPARLNRRD